MVVAGYEKKTLFFSLAGCYVGTSVFGIHRNAAVWENPNVSDNDAPQPNHFQGDKLSKASCATVFIYLFIKSGVHAGLRPTALSPGECFQEVSTCIRALLSWTEVRPHLVAWTGSPWGRATVTLSDRVCIRLLCGMRMFEPPQPPPPPPSYQHSANGYKRSSAATFSEGQTEKG